MVVPESAANNLPLISSQASILSKSSQNAAVDLNQNEGFAFQVLDQDQNDGYATYSIEQAWENGEIAWYHRAINRIKRGYQFLYPRLSCQECCFPTLNRLIPIGDSEYDAANENTNRWYDGHFISAFGSLAAHYAHKAQLIDQSLVDRPTLIHVTYPKQIIQDADCHNLPLQVKRIVAVMHHQDHYGVMEINIQSRSVTIFDGMNRSLLVWEDHILNALKRCKLTTLEVAHVFTPVALPEDNLNIG